jgi:hypothetical protein
VAAKSRTISTPFLVALDNGVKYTEDVLVLVLVVEVLISARRRRPAGGTEIQYVVHVLVARSAEDLLGPTDILGVVLEFREGEGVLLDSLAELLM